MSDELQKTLDWLAEHPGALAFGAPKTVMACGSVGLTATGCDLVPEGTICFIDKRIADMRMSEPQLPAPRDLTLWERGFLHPGSLLKVTAE